jgi:hypothetical protein
MKGLSFCPRHHLPASFLKTKFERYKSISDGLVSPDEFVKKIAENVAQPISGQN